MNDATKMQMIEHAESVLAYWVRKADAARQRGDTKTEAYCVKEAIRWANVHEVLDMPDDSTAPAPDVASGPPDAAPTRDNLLEPYSPWLGVRDDEDYEA